MQLRSSTSTGAFLGRDRKFYGNQHRQGRAAVAARASKSKVDDMKSESDASKPQIGFRWDGTLQRWQTDKRVGAQVWNDVPKMATKTGGDYVIWPVVWQSLTTNGLKSVSPDEAKKLISKGALFVDVRTPDNYSAERLPDALSVPLFVPVQGTEIFDKVKRFVMTTAFAMQATERNTRFAEAAEEQLPNKKATIIVYCNRGGRLETGRMGRRGKFDDKDLSFGIESRSLKGCYELMEAGYTNVLHLDGGLGTWRHQKNPTIKS